MEIKNEKINGKLFNAFLIGNYEQDNFYLHRKDVLDSGKAKSISTKMKKVQELILKP